MKRTPFPLEVYSPQPKGSNGRQLNFSKKLFQNFWNFSADKASKLLEQKDPDYWEQKGAQLALQLFYATAERVPAYKDFLKKNSIRPSLIKTIKDFKKIPTVNKKNYLEKYPIEDLHFDGKFFNNQMISVSSGSSGNPFFWPRSGILEMETTYVQEMFLKKFFRIHKRSTLYINCFAMGMYIAGPIILNSALRISQKGYPLTIITPGLSMDDIMRVLPSISTHFDQIIIAGYPPYVKDIIEEGRQRGIYWHKMAPKLILAGEGFSEKWRERVAELGGIENPRDSIINLYGTADASIVGHETPESITIRRFADQDTKLRQELFGEKYSNRLPTLVQYLPTQKYFESINNELHFTATSGIPLIRYNIHDDGGLISYQKAASMCKERKHDVLGDLNKKAKGSPSWKLPYVYLYGRSDFTVVIYGANVYPENIKAALETKNIINKTTGRFIMSVEYNQRQDPHLHIHVEISDQEQNTKALEEKIQTVITKTLLRINYEYRSSYQAKGDMLRPVVQLHEKGDDKIFPRTSIKQRWTDN